MSRYFALSIVAPHGANIASGRKMLEVRSWRPPVIPLRDLVIVENQRYLREENETDSEGVAMALVDVVAVESWEPEQLNEACSTGWKPGYYAWHLSNVRPILGRPKVVAARKIYELNLEQTLVAEMP